MYLDRWLIRFYSANLLFPKENKETHELMFACQTCQYSEKATSSCVYRNNLDTSIGETAGVTQDVGSDPTVGAPDFCDHCGQEIVCVHCMEEWFVEEPHENVNDANDANNNNMKRLCFDEFSEWAEEEGDEENPDGT